MIIVILLFIKKKANALEELIEPQTENIDVSLSILESYISDTLENKSIIFVGDGSNIYKNNINLFFSSANFVDSKLNTLNSYALGLAGFNKYNIGIYSTEVLPLYLKKPQAQRLLEEKEKKLNK